MTTASRGLASNSGWEPGLLCLPASGTTDGPTVLGDLLVRWQGFVSLRAKARQLGGPGAGAPGVLGMSARGACTTGTGRDT
jgi:hypothetical protein